MTDSVIPIAPKLNSFEDSLAPSSYKFKNVKNIKCSSLSKKNCTVNPSCEYSDEYNQCEPKYSTTNISPLHNLSYEEHLFQSRKLWRDKVTDWLNGQTCEINNYMKNVTILTNKTSASSSIVIMGMIQPTALDSRYNANNRNVVIKLTFTPDDILNTSLEVERAIYQNIITKLINNRNTPNVMSYLGYISCTSKLSNIFTGKQINDMNPSLNILQYNYDVDSGEKHFLFSELSNGVTLDKWFSSYRTEKDIIHCISSCLHINVF